MKSVAIIPARSGSKGLPDKNIKVMNGKPMMAYSIEAAIRSEQFDTVMVSTDSERYAEIARQFGAEVPFLRSATASSDHASSWDTVSEVLDQYQKQGKTFEAFCLLQPTSPLRTADDIIAAYRIFCQSNAFAVVSVCELDHPLSWCGTLGKKGSLDGFMERASERPRQSEAVNYRINGAIYIVRTEEFKKDHFLYRDGCFASIMQREHSVDIDTQLDFTIAEAIMLNRRGRKDAHLEKEQ